MKDYRGFLIRNERKRLNISLEALSHGICSPSYLSKIENNTLIANDSIYDLLLEKLGMQLLDKVEEEKLRSMLDVLMQVLLVCIVRKKWVYYSNILKIPVVWILGSSFLKILI